MDNLAMDNSLSAAILASIPEPFFVFDENGRYVEILGGADRDKYHEGRHLIGKYIHDVIEKDLADVFLAQIRKAIQQERFIPMSTSLPRAISRVQQTAGP
jgi:transcriptional regulator with PAS, ATPase and Fis domain